MRSLIETLDGIAGRVTNRLIRLTPRGDMT